MRIWSVGKSASEPGPWARELIDFVRAFCGAFLFGMPLLFTMEMWWLGTYAHPVKLLALLGIAFVANLGLAYFTGFKRESGHGRIVNQAVDAMVVGAMGSTVVLLVLNRIGSDDPLSAIVGRIVVQIVPLSIGASVANAIFAPGRERDDVSDENGDEPPQLGRWHATLNELGATLTGAVFIGFSIAPTEEVPMLAVGLTVGHELALIGLSLLLTYAIVFESGFDPATHPRRPGLIQSPLLETAIAYVLSLMVAFGALYLYNEVNLGDPLSHILTQTLVLGLPSAIGGAAGRLVV